MSVTHAMELVLRVGPPKWWDSWKGA